MPRKTGRSLLYHPSFQLPKKYLRPFGLVWNLNNNRRGGFMPIRKAEAEWKGNLVQGSGRLKVGSGAFEGPYSSKSRLEEGQSATNPEELMGAAHAGCF